MLSSPSPFGWAYIVVVTELACAKTCSKSKLLFLIEAANGTITPFLTPDPCHEEEDLAFLVWA